MLIIGQGRGMPYKDSLLSRIYEEGPDLPGARIRVLFDFLSSMLQMDPKERVSLADLMCHRWWLEETAGFPTYPCKCGVTELSAAGDPKLDFGI